MAQYLGKVRILSSQLEHFEIIHVPHSENSWVDTLSRLAITAPESLGRTFIEHLEAPSIAEEAREVHQIETEPSWMDPIIKFLNEGVLPEDKAEAKKTRWMASQYVILDGILYKRSFS